MKRTIVLLLALTGIVFLGGCQKRDGEVRTITWMTVRPLYQNAQKVIVGLTEEYMAANPNFRVEFMSIQDRPSYYQRLTILAANNALPEIFDAEGDTLTAQIAAGGALVDVDELYAELDYLDRILRIGLDYGRLNNGRLYTLAWENNIEYIWYRKSLFEKAGIAGPPETFDELLDVSRRLENAGITPIAIWGNEGWPLLRWMAFIPFRLHGNEYIENLKVGRARMADPVGLQAAEFFRTLSGYFMPGWSTATYDGALDAFLSGNAAMYYIGSWQFNTFMDADNELLDDFAFFHMPTIEGAVNGRTDLWAHAGTGTAIRKDTFDDQVRDYIAFILDRYPERVFKETRIFPAADFDATGANLSSFEMFTLNERRAMTSYGYCWDVRMDTATTDVITREIVNLGMGAITPQVFAGRVDAAIAVNAPRFFGVEGE